MGGASSWSLVGGADSYPSSGWGFVSGEIRGSCVPGGPLASSLMRGAVIPPGLLFSLGLLSTDGWGQTFPKWLPLEEHMLMNIPEIFASNVPPQQRATVTPCFLGRSSKNFSQV